MNDIVKEFMNEFESKIPNSKIYMVGGCVRDSLLGKEPQDYDFCTNVSIDEIEKHFLCFDIGRSKDFGIVSVVYEGESFEVAQFRTDSLTSGNSRHPDSVNFDATLEEDLMRRDFTINAMAIGTDGELIDPFNGKKDLKEGVINAVGHAERRLEEDALRILRAVRFEVTYNFNMNFELGFQIRLKKHNLEYLTQERITQEILKVADKGGKVFYRWMKRLDELELIPVLFPEIEESKKYKHYYIHHPEGATMIDLKTLEVEPLNRKAIEKGTHAVKDCGTVYDHIFACLACLEDTDDRWTCLSVLYHDIGKNVTAELKDEEFGTSGFKMHEHKGVKVFEEIAQKRRFSSALAGCVSFCIENHMNANNKEISKKSKMLELATSPFFDVLFRVSRCDDKSRNVFGNELYDEEVFDKNMQRYIDLRNTYVDKQNLKKKIAEFVDGKKVMELRNIKPSKEVGEVIEAVTQFLIENDFDISVEEVDNFIKNYNE